MAKARVANVDRRDSSIGLTKRIPRGLRRAAPGDQDFLVSTRFHFRPNQMKLGPATVRVIIEVAVFVQTGKRGRIGHTFVEVADLLAAVHLTLLGCRGQDGRLAAQSSSGIVYQ